MKNGIHYILEQNMQCKKCSESINVKTDAIVRCKGRCCEAFHAHCVGLTPDTIRSFCRNIIWLCDDCLVEFGKVRYQPIECIQQPVEIMKEITELKAEITDIKENAFWMYV